MGHIGDLHALDHVTAFQLEITHPIELVRGVRRSVGEHGGS
jgi:hypothetical protein